MYQQIFFVCQVCGHVPRHPDCARGSDGAGHGDRGGRGQHCPPTQEPGSYFLISLLLSTCFSGDIWSAGYPANEMRFWISKKENPNPNFFKCLDLCPDPN